MNSALLLIGMLLIGGNSLAQLSTFPYYQDFESFTTCVGSCNSPCALSDGWSNEQAGGDGGEWSTDENGTSSSSTGPSVDFDPGNSTGNYLYFETSSPCSPNVTAILYAPVLDLSGVGGMDMIFSNHMYGSSQGTMSVDVSTDGGTTWINNLWTKSGDSGDQWFTDTVNLTAYAGMSSVTVRFRGVSTTSFTSDMAIDAVTFYEPLPLDAGISAIPSPGLPSCNLVNSPVSGTVLNYGTDTLVSVDVNWSVNSVLQTPFSWTGALPNGSDTTIALGTYTFTNGDLLEVWTSNPNAGTEMGGGPLNDTSTIIIQTGLSGTYSIGIAGAYTNFTDAVAALSTYGVCGPVVFDVDDGTYTEQIAIPEIMGASATNTITFQSLNADPALVIMDYSAIGGADNFTVQMTGADHVTFKEITLRASGTIYGNVINITNESSYNTFDGNVIIGDSNVNTTSANMALVTCFSGTLDSMNVFTNNELAFGSYSMYYSGVNTTVRTNGVTISNNNMHDFYYRGIHSIYIDNTVISNNIIEPSAFSTGSVYRIYMYYNNGDVQIANNEIRGMNYGYGWYLSNCTGSAATPSQIYNNFVHVGDTANTSTSYGGYFTNVSNHNIANNSFNITSNGTTSRGLCISGGTGNDIYNNNIVNDGPGYGMYLLGGMNVVDHNNIYAPNGRVGYFGSDQITLVDWQTATGFDMNSVSGDPMYTSYDDLHSCNDSLLDGNGMIDANITMDIDGQLRDAAAFDIGADEFLGLANFGFSMDTIWKCSVDAEILGGWDPSDDGTYLWSTTETTPTISATAPGTYDVTVTTGCGTAMSSVELVDIPDAVAGFSVLTSFMTGIFSSSSSGTIDTYSWDFGDGVGTSTDESPIYVYGSQGTYVVTLTVTGPCGTDVYTDTMVASVVGIDENSLSQSIELFPNPNTGEFTINLNLDQQVAVSAVILDAQGRVVWNRAIENVNGSVSQSVNLGSDASGVYFLRITADNETAVRKVIVE